jgi:hypothetical protein
MRRRWADRQQRHEAQQREALRQFEDASPFDWLFIPCTSREAAQAEARLQQAADTDDAEWIYEQVNGHWVAKRTPTDPALLPPLQQVPFWVKLIGALLNPYGGWE